MYCGLPILAEDFVEERRIIEETRCGILVDSSSPASIADAVIRLLRDYKTAKEMGQNGREAVLKKYNFESHLPKIIHFYGEAMKG